jgi:hypothetical protein
VQVVDTVDDVRANLFGGVERRGDEVFRTFEAQTIGDNLFTKQIAERNSRARDFVDIRGTDSPARRSDRLRAARFFTRAVGRRMERKNDVCAIRDANARRVDSDALQGVKFCAEPSKTHDRSAADEEFAAFLQHAGGHDAQR